MFNRREFGMTSVTALAAVAATGSVFAQQKAGGRSESEEMFQKCAKACSDCQRECDQCATHCGHLLSEGKKDHLNMLMTCRDCATICVAAAQVVASGGPSSSIICESCATACGECAKACEQHPTDSHMKACAEECRKCEKACREMLHHSTRK